MPIRTGGYMYHPLACGGWGGVGGRVNSNYFPEWFHTRRGFADM